MTLIDGLRHGFRGELIDASHPGYDDARHVWNGMIDKRPGMIARCSGTADVAAAIAFGRAEGLPIAVRGGAHNVAGNASCDDGVVIDLSPMQGVRVDPEARRARAQGGVTWGLLDRETQLHGLATTGGAISTTGISGLTLGGGLGHLMRRQGLSCDNLTAAQIVTADGDVLETNESQHAELFWALRGGGGNFGVVTSLEYRLHSVGPVVFGGLIAYHIDRAAEVLALYRDFVATAPADLGLNCLFVTAPPLPFVPEHLQFQPIVAIVVCWAGDIDEGAALVAPLRAFGEPALDLLGPIPYCVLQQMFDDGFPAGRRSYWKAGYLGEVTDGAIDTYVANTSPVPSPFSIVECQALGGAFAHEPDGGTAFAHRDAAFVYNVIACWEGPEHDESQIAWARSFDEAMRPHATGGVYVNYLGDEGTDRVRAAYGPERYARLVAVKAKHDPHNVFRLNQNINPQG